jgi:hypothetical protein
MLQHAHGLPAGTCAAHMTAMHNPPLQPALPATLHPPSKVLALMITSQAMPLL